ncbi:MAG: peptidylprolyl isomerase [Holophagales bacterium]|nr:MAG: peptidylprolyl isomerase [Holophagales bacterium]
MVLLLAGAVRGAEPPPQAASTPIRVEIRTDLGVIEIALEPTRAPTTVANFLRYVDAGRYDGGRFHRTVRPDNEVRPEIPIEVVQAGVAPGRELDDFPPISLERTRDTGLRHVDGAISMARDAPDSATSDFFVCLGDQPALDFGGQRNPDGQGFAVFGRVVSGMGVLRRIQAAPASGQTLTPPILIRTVRRLP